MLNGADYVLRSLGALASLTAVASAGGACSTETPGAGGAGGAGGASQYEQSECYACVRESCEVEIAACRAEPGCADYLDCLIRCSAREGADADPGCDQTCVEASPSEATRAVASVVSCRRDGPGQKCAPCGIGEPTPLEPSACEPRPDAPTACRQCYWDKCCETWDRCFAADGNMECDALNTCTSLCVGADRERCTELCFESHPTGLDDYLAHLSCATIHCAVELEDGSCDPSRRDPCETCVFSDCGKSFVDLVSNPDGRLLYVCLTTCEKLGACVDDCFERHSEGSTLAYLWLECVDYRCSEADGC